MSTRAEIENIAKTIVNSALPASDVMVKHSTLWTLKANRLKSQIEEAIRKALMDGHEKACEKYKDAIEAWETSR